MLKTCTLTTLKQMCRLLRIKNYSGLRKNELILFISKYHAIIKLQKWVRKILSKNELCPISCEPIRYPCFVFKTPNNVLIYYNLLTLRNFLIKTGDFRDPSTRTEYTNKQLLELDNIYNYYEKLHPTINQATINQATINQSTINQATEETAENYFKSVFKASKNKRFYQRIKDREQEQLIFERILDSICDGIIELIGENNKNNFFILETVYLYEYQTQFRRLLNRSNSHAEYVINKNISNLNQINHKESYNDNQHKTCEYTVIFLYQLREELY